MPLYEFRCQDCGAEQEILVRNEHDLVCEACGARTLEKMLSVPASPAMGSSKQLPMYGPVSSPSGGGCGLPQCGQGRCAGGM
jgi:putative FmdB family regulatory protein